MSGARPSGIDDHSIAQLAQTWRINEYHLLSPLPTEDRPQNVPMSLESAPIPEGSTSRRDPKNVFTPLPNGDANLAHLPEGITITEWEEKSKEGLDVFLPGETKIVRRYVRYPGFLATTPTTSRDQIKTHVTNDTSNKDTGDKREQVRNNWSEEDRTKDEDEYKTRVLDILLAGDGHSGWGEFKIYGRVRPSDGLITILKEYVCCFTSYFIKCLNANNTILGVFSLVKRRLETVDAGYTAGTSLVEEPVLEKGKLADILWEDGEIHCHLQKHMVTKVSLLWLEGVNIPIHPDRGWL